MGSLLLVFLLCLLGVMTLDDCRLHVGFVVGLHIGLHVRLILHLCAVI
jgi:hypothetical protein